MKCETSNTILTFMLGLLALLGVMFALQAVFHSRDLRSLQTQAIVAQSNLQRINLLLNDSIEYAKTHPDLGHILQPFEAKPVAR